MPLIPQVLQLDILDALRSLSNNDGATLEQSQFELSQKLAGAIDRYIKSATIIVPPGQTVAGGGGGPIPVTGATVSPSSPAQIT